MDGSGGSEGPVVGTTQESVPVIVVDCALAATRRVKTMTNILKYILIAVGIAVRRAERLG